MTQNWQVLAASKTITIHSSQSDYPNPVNPIAQYNPHRGIVNCAVYNHTGKVIASCGQDGKISLHSAIKCQDKLMQLTYYSSQQQPSSINCCLFSPKSRYIGAGSVNSTVKVWEMKSTTKQKQLLHKLKGHSGAVTSIGWINNQDIIASSSTSGDILLHDLASGGIRQSLSTRMKQGINNIKVSEGDGYKRIGACTNAGSLMIWDINVSSKKAIYTYEDPKKSSFSCFSISYYRPEFMVCSSIDSSFFFVDIKQKNRIIKDIPTEQPLTSISFNDDGQMIAVGGMSGGLMIYDLRKYQSPMFKLAGHDTPIKSVFFAEKEKQKVKPKQKQFAGTSSNYSKISSNIGENGIQTKDAPKNRVLTSVLSSNKLLSDQQRLGNQKIRNLAKKQDNVGPTKQNQERVTPQVNNFTETQVQPNLRPQSISISSNSNPNSFTYAKATVSQISAPQQYQEAIYTQNSQNRNIQERMIEQIRNVEMRMNQKFELLHLEVIRQMQMSVEKMGSFFQKKYLYQKELEGRIKRLEQQNENLKKRTY